jgi:hypothetical protein
MLTLNLFLNVRNANSSCTIWIICVHAINDVMSTGNKGLQVVLP